MKPLRCPAKSASTLLSSDGLLGWFPLKRLVWGAIVAGTAWILPFSLQSQTCFFYVDNENALVPIQCVDKMTLLPPCAPPADCTTLVAGGSQTVLEMHEIWHQCFGSTLTAFPGGQPVGRGQRWYAFHRQYEVDFNAWRDDHGFAKIESLNWCPDMLLPLGHPSAAPGGIPGHPAGCGDGNPRPANTVCSNCVAFPSCLFFQGAGPNCGPGVMGSGSGFCTVGGTTYTALEQFPNVDVVSEVLDGYFHGAMHGAVGAADGGSYVDDVLVSPCSPRDPMFWRLHKALDDVVRAWQDQKATDIILVLDKSGSMSGLDSGGMTKLNAALEAARMFADILDQNRADGMVNRIGIVTFSSSATLNLGLTPAGPGLLNPGGALDTALNNIAAAGPGGSTAIGAGLQRALDELCGGDCDGYTAPPGENARKAILVLTDGMENVAPCLDTGGSCGGALFDRSRLAFTQVCAVGFGNAGSLDGDTLTLLSEQQGGIYMQNPATDVEHDLKKFFVMAYGQLTDEFLLADPQGFLPAGLPASEPVFYNICSDSRITFASGWKTPIAPGGLRLIVTTPEGNLVRPGFSGVQSSVRGAWDYKRIRLPHRGESAGMWRAHLVRPHRTFVNGFTTDSFADMREGTRLVRRQLQRLCPDGARSVLYYEDGRLGPESVYERALQAEVESGLIEEVAVASSADEFAELLVRDWELIVYAHQTGGEKVQPYDALLVGKLCNGQRAIITENRRDLGNSILRCAGALIEGDVNWEALRGDGRLFDGTLRLVNHGYEIFTWGLVPLGASVIQGVGQPGGSGGIVARAATQGVDQNWFVGILGRGLSKLDPHLQHSIRRTGDDLIASVRLLPSYFRAGGYDDIKARVEVTFPREGLGNLFTERLDRPQSVNGDALTARGATLSNSNLVTIPTGTAVFPLYDDGTMGDLHPDNQYWTTILPGLAQFDGMYEFRFLLDFTVAGCTTHRELLQSVFVDSKADPDNTTVEVVADRLLNDGARLTQVRIIPRDFFQNLWGPGRPGDIRCVSGDDCRLGEDVVDHGDGSYTVSLVTPPGVAGIRLQAFNAPLNLPITCEECPRLSELVLDPDVIEEFELVRATVVLSGPAPSAGGDGARVYLRSSDTEIAAVPEFILVRPGETSASFLISNAHGHGSNTVVITAQYGTESLSRDLVIFPKRPVLVPFEITSIRESGDRIGIHFVSPYRLEKHQLDMRSELLPNSPWEHLEVGMTALEGRNFRVRIPRRPGDSESYFRIRAMLDSHEEQATTSARVDVGRGQPSK